MEQRTAIAVGAICGAVIWGASPVLTGQLEPWDAPGLYYVGGVVVSGVIVGALAPPRSLWLGPLAIGLGQAVWIFGMMLFRNEGNLWPLTIVALVLAAVPALVGSAIGAGLRGIWTKKSGG